jgi:hypothetical protein
VKPSRRRRQIVAAALSVLGAFVCMVPIAAAELGPIQLVSKTPLEQAGFAKQPAVSVDGNFVAFYGELGGHTGLFRKNLTSGELTLVVEGLAEFPSISAEGRFISFTTKLPLDPAADGEAGSSDVYVADLASTPPTFQIASATVTAGETRRLGGSSTAAPRVALSADGREVAFVNGGQVYVRRLAEPEPVLITTRLDPMTGATTSEPVEGGGAFGRAGAALSADGNAVAWVGEHRRSRRSKKGPGRNSKSATGTSSPSGDSCRRPGGKPRPGASSAAATPSLQAAAVIPPTRRARDRSPISSKITSCPGWKSLAMKGSAGASTFRR